MPWNLASELKNSTIEIVAEKKRDIAEMPFNPSSPPYELVIKGRIIENWVEKNNSAGRPPQKSMIGKRANIKLIPYGCTNLRISHFPIIET